MNIETSLFKTNIYSEQYIHPQVCKQSLLHKISIQCEQIITRIWFSGTLSPLRVIGLVLELCWFEETPFRFTLSRLNVQLSNSRTTHPTSKSRKGLICNSSKTPTISSITCKKPYFFFQDRVAILSKVKYSNKEDAWNSLVQPIGKVQNKLAGPSVFSTICNGFISNAKKSGSSVVSSPAMKLRIAFRWQILAFCQNG